MKEQETRTDILISTFTPQIARARRAFHTFERNPLSFRRFYPCLSGREQQFIFLAKRVSEVERPSLGRMYDENLGMLFENYAQSLKEAYENTED